MVMVPPGAQVTSYRQYPISGKVHSGSYAFLAEVKEERIYRS